MWQCRKCQSRIEDSFDVCWKCGTTKDGVDDPDFQPADTEDSKAAGGAEDVGVVLRAGARHGTATNHLLAHFLVLGSRVLALVVFFWGLITLSEMTIAGGDRGAHLRGPEFDRYNLAQTEALFTAAIVIVTGVALLLAVAEALRLIIIEANTRRAQKPSSGVRGKRRH